jgi:hypothetical protein
MPQEAAMDEQVSEARRTWDEVFVVAYTVELLNWPDLALARRATLETRFAAELEHRFGAGEQVVLAFFKSLAEREAWEETLASDMPALLTEWDQAEAQARAATLAGIDAPVGARFWLSFYDEVYDKPQ